MIIEHHWPVNVYCRTCWQIDSNDTISFQLSTAVAIPHKLTCDVYPACSVWQCVVINRLHKLTEQCMWVYSDRGLSCSSVEQPQNSITACGCSIRYHGSYGNRGSIDQRTSLWKATANMRRSLVVSALNCQPKGQGLHPRQGWQVARIVDTGPPAPDIMNIQE